MKELRKNAVTRCFRILLKKESVFTALYSVEKIKIEKEVNFFQKVRKRKTI